MSKLISTTERDSVSNVNIKIIKRREAFECVWNLKNKWKQNYYNFKQLLTASGKQT